MRVVHDRYDVDTLVSTLKLHCKRIGEANKEEKNRDNIRTPLGSHRLPTVV